MSHRINDIKHDVLRKARSVARKNDTLVRLRQKLLETRFESGVGSGGGVPRQKARVFFVVGVPKSGTTWLMRTLDRHPEILCRGEGRFFDQQMRRDNLKEMQTSEHIKFKIQPSSLYHSLSDSEDLRLWIERSVWTRDDDAEEHMRNLTRVATNYFLSQKLRKSGKKMVGDKTPLSSTKIMREISEIYPSARVIHIIRDGRDTAVSRIHHNWNRAIDRGGTKHFAPEELDKRERYRKDPEGFRESGESIFTDRLIRESAKIWETRTRAAHHDGPALLKDNYAEVRYEDLLERPQEEFRRLFSFLEARDDEKTVARCVEATSFEKRAGRARGKEDAGSGMRKGISGDWKNVFTGNDRDVFKKIAGDLLVELGYEDNRDW